MARATTRTYRERQSEEKKPEGDNKETAEEEERATVVKILGSGAAGLEYSPEAEKQGPAPHDAQHAREHPPGTAAAIRV